MEKLLFESKGAPRNAKIMIGVSGLIFSVLGVLLIVISQMRHKSHSVYLGRPGGSMDYQGSVGGGYVVNEGARNMLMALGWITIILGILIFGMLLSLKHMYLGIYENHLEGSMVLFIFKVDYNIQYNQITGIQLANNVLVVYFLGKTKRIVTKDEQTAKKVYEIIERQRANQCHLVSNKGS